MYIVREGALEVMIRDNSGNNIRARHLRSGDFFGEMKLLTGDTRSATVSASTDAVLYEIGKQALEQFLQNNPNIAEEICQVVTSRRNENADLLGNRPAGVDEDRGGWLGGQLLARIRRFLGL